MNFLANGWVRNIERYCQSIATDEELSINFNIASNAIHHCSCIRLRRFRQIHLRHIAKELIFLVRYGISRVCTLLFHYSDFIMGSMASQITNVSIVCSTVCSGADQRKQTSKLRVTGLCKGNPPVTGGCPSQRASNAVNVSIWWRHHAFAYLLVLFNNFECAFSFASWKMELRSHNLSLQLANQSWHKDGRERISIPIDADYGTSIINETKMLY